MAFVLFVLGGASGLRVRFELHRAKLEIHEGRADFSVFRLCPPMAQWRHAPPSGRSSVAEKTGADGSLAPLP